MAGIARLISRRHYVIDTGYLDELYSIDQRSKSESIAEVKRRVGECIERNDILYVPLPVLFEVGGHIAAVKSGERRRVLAERLRGAVTLSCNDRLPWVIRGGGDAAPRLMDALQRCCEEFAESFAAAGESLTDVAVIHEARRLKKELAAQRDRRHFVHVWTRDRAVKAMEPDREEDSFV